MAQSPHQLAIDAALSANWSEAVRLNEEIITLEPENVDTLNRLARAYFELGDLSKSKKNYETALKLDPYNQIAFKFLKRIEAFKKRPGKIPLHPHENQQAGTSNHNHTPISHNNLSDLFIEEPGKTKQVTLLKVAEPQKILALACGDQVNLVAKARYISVTDQYNEYLGVLPDDISHRLIKFIKGGNKYLGFVKTVKPNGLSILVKEIYRSSRFRNQPTFLDNISISKISYSSDHIILGDDLEDKGMELLETDDDGAEMS